MPSPRAAARKDRLKRVIAIVDYGGHLVLLLKDDVTRVGSIEIAILTARTAGHFNHPTKAFPIAERLDRCSTLLPGLRAWGPRFVRLSLPRAPATQAADIDDSQRQFRHERLA